MSILDELELQEWIPPELGSKDGATSIAGACPWCKGPMDNLDAELLGTCWLCYDACKSQQDYNFFFFPGVSKK